MNTELEKALKEYAEVNSLTSEESAEQILGSFLITAGFLKRPIAADERSR